MKVRLLTLALFSFTIEYNVRTNILISDASTAAPDATLYRVSSHPERHTAARACFQICPRGFPDRTVAWRAPFNGQEYTRKWIIIKLLPGEAFFLYELVLGIRDVAKRRHSGSVFRLDSKAKWTMYWFWNLIFNFPFSWSNCWTSKRSMVMISHGNVYPVSYML